MTRPKEPEALVWARRRHQGETLTEIARSAGVSIGHVQRQTFRYGPFKDPRTILREHDPRTSSAELIRRRRAGESVTSIVRDTGLGRTTIERLTQAGGPYPATSCQQRDVDGWVKARRDGVSIAAIARAAKVSDKTVSRLTAPYGPFPRPSRQPPGLVGSKGVARVLGVSEPTIARWRHEGFLPQPAKVTRGVPLWLPSRLTTWADQVGLPVCPECGARPRDLQRHAALRHART